MGRLCPATELVPLATSETSPLREASHFKNFSPDHYRGYFHTDHLVPSVFFAQTETLEEPKIYEPLSFRYIFDLEADPADHAELMAGLPATWFRTRNMDRLPDYVNPEGGREFSGVARGRLANWAEKRLQERLA